MKKIFIDFPEFNTIESKVDALTKIVNESKSKVELPKLFSRNEAANILGVCPKTLTKYCKEGRIKFYQPSRKYLFKLEDLDFFLIGSQNFIDNDEY